MSHDPKHEAHRLKLMDVLSQLKRGTPWAVAGADLDPALEEEMTKFAALQRANEGRSRR